MLRRIHRLVGIVMAPLLTVTALVGGTMVLLERFDPNTKVVGFETRRLLTEIHNYQIASDVATLILAGGVLTMTSTGSALWIQSAVRKRKSKRLAKASRGA
jgi:uncharacterized iron-regulated membrane protein